MHFMLNYRLECSFITDVSMQLHEVRLHSSTYSILLHLNEKYIKQKGF